MKIYRLENIDDTSMDTWRVGFLYKSRMRELLNNDFINYEGPMHISTSKNLVDDKKYLVEQFIWMLKKILNYIKKL